MSEMQTDISLKQFNPLSCMVLELAEDRAVIEFGQDGGKFMLQGSPTRLGNITWKKSGFLVFDAKNHEQVVMRFFLELWKESNNTDYSDMQIGMSILPGIKTRIALPIEVFNGQTLYLKRTPGKLKTVVYGNKVELDEVNKIAISLRPFINGQKLEILNMHLVDAEPEYPLPDVKLVDELGQAMIREWPGKTNGEDELKAYLTDEAQKRAKSIFHEDWSNYGGWKLKRFEATGFFRTQYDGKRWWLVDPEGYAFFSTGLDCVLPGETGWIGDIEKLFLWLPERNGEFSDAYVASDTKGVGQFYSFAISNLLRVFGSQWLENWTRITRRRLIEWGFNTIGNWSSMDFIKAANMPYVYPLKDFPNTEKKIFRDFPDVFSDEYCLNAVRFAQQLQVFTGDKYMIGYFLQNEPHWAFVKDINIAEKLLETKEELISKDAFINFISERYNGSIAMLNNAWRTSFNTFENLREGVRGAAAYSEASAEDLKVFSRIMIERYTRIPCEEVKKVDPHHLNLGMRYAYVASQDLLAGCEHFDVFTINNYMLNPAEEVERVGQMTGLPVMIGEFHFGALDRGMISTGLKGVLNQEERGKAYKYYVENAAASKYCIGTHYFVLNDQAFLGRRDGENYQIGLVNVCHKPYEEFIKGIVETHGTIYEVAEGKKEKYSVEPIEIPRN